MVLFASSSASLMWPISTPLAPCRRDTVGDIPFLPHPKYWDHCLIGKAVRRVHLRAFSRLVWKDVCVYGGARRRRTPEGRREGLISMGGASLCRTPYGLCAGFIFLPPPPPARRPCSLAALRCRRSRPTCRARDPSRPSLLVGGARQKKHSRPLPPPPPISSHAPHLTPSPLSAPTPSPQSSLSPWSRSTQLKRRTRRSPRRPAAPTSACTSRTCARRRTPSRAST
jgi:hypothetical protein